MQWPPPPLPPRTLADWHTIGAQQRTQQSRSSAEATAAPPARRLSHTPCLPFSTRVSTSVAMCVQRCSCSRLLEDGIECYYALLDRTGRAERLVARCVGSALPCGCTQS